MQFLVHCQCVTLSRITGFLSLRLLVLWRICGCACTVSVQSVGSGALRVSSESFCVDGQAQLWPEPFRNLSALTVKLSCGTDSPSYCVFSAEVAHRKDLCRRIISAC